MDHGRDSLPYKGGSRSPRSKIARKDCAITSGGIKRNHSQTIGQRTCDIYQQDNASPHTLRLSQQCLQGYDVLKGPCSSLDLSAIEHVWNMLGSDEAHFWLNGYVNKQNCRIWSEANPQVYVETPLHPAKLTVWCALWAGGILLQKR
ncbi:putative DD41D transposase [Trichonephila clavipes]|nr:putative DD41D transposase [Trichonephila clavipes]